MSVNPYDQPPSQTMPHYGAPAQQQQTTVVINQPGAAGNQLIVGNIHGTRQWTSGLFDCFSDFGTCM